MDNFINSLFIGGDVIVILLIIMLGTNNLILDTDTFVTIGLIYLYSKLAIDLIYDLDDDPEEHESIE